MRLLRPPQFQRAFRQGSRAKSKYLLVVAVPHTGPTRLGLSVGKRIFRHAHRRNRLKRILREAFRLEYGALPQGVDLVIVPALPGCDPSLAEARKELVTLAHKALRRYREKHPQEGSPKPQEAS